jgi:hypothetical protein
MTRRVVEMMESAAGDSPVGVSPASVMRAPGRGRRHNRFTVHSIRESGHNQQERVDDRINVRVDARTLPPGSAPRLRGGLRAECQDSCAQPPALLPPEVRTCNEYSNASVFHLHGEACGPGARYAGTERERNALGGARSHSILSEQEYGLC